MRPDTSITYLKSLGYSVLRLPRADVLPLQVLLRKGKDLVRLGHITELMQEGSVPPPEVSSDSPNGWLALWRCRPSCLWIDPYLASEMYGLIRQSRDGE